MSKQRTFQFEQLVKLIPTMNYRNVVNDSPMHQPFFNFPGHLNIERRPGQFQYRYGMKVQPKDEIL